MPPSVPSYIRLILGLSLLLMSCADENTGSSTALAQDTSARNDTTDVRAQNDSTDSPDSLTPPAPDSLKPPAPDSASPPPSPPGEAFVVQIPSESAGSQGIAVRVVPPTGAPRYDEGAPIVVAVPGGWDSGSLETELQVGAHKQGMVYIEWLLPGGSASNGEESGGTYDIRGAACNQALIDVLRYAAGELADSDGAWISDRIPNALTAEVGAIGSSNGGNLILTALGNHLDVAPKLAWYLAWESPLGDQFAAIDLNKNPYYVPGTCTATTCPTPGQAEALSWSPSGTSQAMAQLGESFPGKVVLGGTDAGTNLFSTYPAGLDANGAIQLYPSQELAADFRSQQDTLWSEGPPGWLVIDAGQNEAYWLQRDGALHIAAIHTALPDLLAMHLQKTSDHVQNQPDYPHARAHLLGWQDAGHAWFRLNPDAVYMTALMDTETVPSDLPDNDANTLVQWPEPGPQMVPDQYGQVLKLAGILELADRVHFNDSSPNLDALLTVYNEDTSTNGPGSANPDLACEPGQTAMCCGDGVCDGPETLINCPEDCTEGTGSGDDQTDCKPGATACCGNQICEGPENAQNCSVDCSR